MPATPSHRPASAWSTPSLTARTGGPCNAGPAGATTCPRPSRRSAHWCPTAPQPGNPPPRTDHTDTPGKDAPSLIAHHVVRARRGTTRRLDAPGAQATARIREYEQRFVPRRVHNDPGVIAHGREILAGVPG